MTFKIWKKGLKPAEMEIDCGGEDPGYIAGRMLQMGRVEKVEIIDTGEILERRCI